MIFLIISALVAAGLTFLYYKFGFKSAQLWVRIVSSIPILIIWGLLIYSLVKKIKGS